MIDYWEGDAYPDFVAEGTGDQHAINAAICAVKKAGYNGIDCVGGDDTATGPTGTVRHLRRRVLGCLGIFGLLIVHRVVIGEGTAAFCSCLTTATDQRTSSSGVRQ